MSFQGILFAIPGAVIGGSMWGEEGFVLGLIGGYGFGVLKDLSARVKRLEHRLRESPPAGTDAAVMAGTQSAAEATTAPLPPAAAPSRRRHTAAAQPPGPAPADPAPERIAPPPRRGREHVVLDRALARVKSFFTDGNVVVKVGLLVLFVGVGFLIKYAAERSLVPVELRIAAMGLAGAVLLVFGWRLRTRKPMYALLLQGGGVGVMYLVVFGAARLYHFIPAGAAFLVMVALVVLSGALAVMQNARYLAFYGAAGGFLAPLLASTGGGSHVMLFSYYALLNLGILGIAWYRSWRGLNLLGFVFTFVIASLWGARYYRPAHFASVEPFLILFFLFFVAIAVLFALRQPPRLRGYVDGTLVFGVPIIAFALQYALVRDMPYGLAFSALGLGAFYLVLATVLWRLAAPGLRLLTEAFLALGVVFASLAIPLALDGRWTSAAWALEGAAIVWVGVRQGRVAARAFGVVLQLGAGLFFVGDLGSGAGDTPVLNGIWVGAALVAAAGLFASHYLYRHRDALAPWEGKAHIPLLAWGLLWWFGAGIHEAGRFVTNEHLALNLVMAFITASLVLAHHLERRLPWPPLRYPVLGQLYAMVAVLALTHGLQGDHPLAHYGWLTWPLAFGALYTFLYRYREVVGEVVLQWQHVFGCWLVVAFVSWEGAWLAGALVGSDTWREVMYGLAPALLMLGLLHKGRRLGWPIATHYDWYAGYAALPVMALLGLYALGMGLLHRSDPWPIVYLPLANPVDILVGLVLYLLLAWRLQLRRGGMPMGNDIDPRLPGYAAAGLAFVWLNGIIARSVHHWSGVAHDLTALMQSVIFQAGISVAWTLVALSVMSVASRRARRETWFAGLGLFIVVILKLFLVDISRQNELVMILSLITVAVLAIVFGYYLSPLPPRDKEQQA